MSEQPRVLFACFDVVPAPHGASRRLTAYLDALSDTFQAVVISTKTPDHSHIERYHGARLLRVPVGSGDLHSRLQTFDRAVRRQLESEEYFAVHFFDPFGGYALCDVREQYGYKLIYDAQTFPSQELRYQHPATESDRRFHSKLRRQELFCLMNADLVLTGSATTRAHILSLGVNAEQVKVLRSPVERTPFTSELMGRPDASPMKLLHLGSQLAYQGLPTVLRALQIALRTVDLRLSIVGPTHAEQHPLLEDLVAQLRLTGKVDFQAPVGHADLHKILATADVGMLALEDVERNRVQGGPLTRLGEYLAAGRPVIAADLPVTRELLPQAAGSFYPPGDFKTLAEVMVRLARDPVLRTTMGEAARAASSVVDAAAVRAQLIAAYELLGSREASGAERPEAGEVTQLGAGVSEDTGLRKRGKKKEPSSADDSGSRRQKTDPAIAGSGRTGTQPALDQEHDTELGLAADGLPAVLGVPLREDPPVVQGTELPPEEPGRTTDPLAPPAEASAKPAPRDLRLPASKSSGGTKLAARTAARLAEASAKAAGPASGRFAGAGAPSRPPSVSAGIGAPPVEGAGAATAGSTVAPGASALASRGAAPRAGTEPSKPPSAQRAAEAPRVPLPAPALTRPPSAGAPNVADASKQALTRSPATPSQPGDSSRPPVAPATAAANPPGEPSRPAPATANAPGEPSRPPLAPGANPAGGISKPLLGPSKLPLAPATAAATAPGEPSRPPSPSAAGGPFKPPVAPGAAPPRPLAQAAPGAASAPGERSASAPLALTAPAGALSKQSTVRLPTSAAEPTKPRGADAATDPSRPGRAAAEPSISARVGSALAPEGDPSSADLPKPAPAPGAELRKPAPGSAVSAPSLRSAGATTGTAPSAEASKQPPTRTAGPGPEAPMQRGSAPDPTAPTPSPAIADAAERAAAGSTPASEPGGTASRVADEGRPPQPTGGPAAVSEAAPRTPVLRVATLAPVAAGAAPPSGAREAPRASPAPSAIWPGRAGAQPLPRASPSRTRTTPGPTAPRASPARGRSEAAPAGPRASPVRPTANTARGPRASPPRPSAEPAPPPRASPPRPPREGAAPPRADGAAPPRASPPRPPREAAAPPRADGAAPARASPPRPPREAAAPPRADGGALAPRQRTEPIAPPRASPGRARTQRTVPREAALPPAGALELPTDPSIVPIAPAPPERTTDPTGLSALAETPARDPADDEVAEVEPDDIAEVEPDDVLDAHDDDDVLDAPDDDDVLHAPDDDDVLDAPDDDDVLHAPDDDEGLDTTHDGDVLDAPGGDVLAAHDDDEPLARSATPDAPQPAAAALEPSSAVEPWLAQLVHGYCPPDGQAFKRPAPPTNFPGRDPARGGPVKP